MVDVLWLVCVRQFEWTCFYVCFVFISWFFRLCFYVENNLNTCSSMYVRRFEWAWSTYSPRVLCVYFFVLIFRVVFLCTKSNTSFCHCRCIAQGRSCGAVFGFGNKWLSLVHCSDPKQLCWVYCSCMFFHFGTKSNTWLCDCNCFCWCLKQIKRKRGR